MTKLKKNDLARVFRAESGQILSALIMLCRDIDLAEDALQDALEQAVRHWSNATPPVNGGAWLYTIAKRRLIDRLRKQTVREKEDGVAAIHSRLYEHQEALELLYDIPEERLRLIFTCCHPALSEQARIALTLKSLCGLTNKEIARAYLMSESAIEQRLTRAKRKIRDAGITYEIPESHALAGRVESVLRVIYLIYNESYSAFEGPCLTRDDFAQEAIRLARLVHELLPLPSVAGLLALLLLHDSRRPARYSKVLGFIPLESQDRSKWDQAQCSEGLDLLSITVAEGAKGAYLLQAAISALHNQSRSWAETDWKQIGLLYQSLYLLEPSPVVFLNHAMAIFYGGDARQASKRLELIEKELNAYQPFFVARATIAASLCQTEFAIENYEIAIGLSKNEIEKDFLHKKLLELEH